MKTRQTKIKKRGGSRQVRACSLVVALLLVFPCRLPATSTAEEYSIKAAYLYHFAQFVEWPEASFKDAESPLTYCTIGEDPFHGSLDAALSGKTIGARSFRVLHFKQPRKIQGCHVLFLGAEQKKTSDSVLATVQQSPVLTVGESEHFAQEGGMIGFVREENKIRFEINLDTAQKARLRISSRLLALAKNVMGGQRGT